MATYAGRGSGQIGDEARTFPTTGPSVAYQGLNKAEPPSTPWGVSMMNGDYAKIAEGMGAVGITCTKVGEVGPAILRARELNAAGTACLIQVMANVEDRRSGDFSMFDTSKL